MKIKSDKEIDAITERADIEKELKHTERLFARLENIKYLLKMKLGVMDCGLEVGDRVSRTVKADLSREELKNSGNVRHKYIEVPYEITGFYLSDGDLSLSALLKCLDKKAVYYVSNHFPYDSVSSLKKL